MVITVAIVYLPTDNVYNFYYSNQFTSMLCYHQLFMIWIYIVNRSLNVNMEKSLVTTTPDS